MGEVITNTLRFICYAIDKRLKCINNTIVDLAELIADQSQRMIYAMITFIKKMIYWGLVIGIAMLVFVNFLQTSGIGKNKRASIDGVLNGTASRPFVYRVFLPVIANALAPVLPAEQASLAGEKSKILLGNKFFMKQMNGRDYPRQVIIILALIYLSLIGFAVTMRYFTEELGYSPAAQYAAPVILVAGCAIFTTGFGYMYDFPQLFLFSLALLLMYRQKWSWYLLALACATLNKETSIFLYPVFALYFFARLPRRHFFALSAAQLALYGLLRGGLMFIFRNNPGSIVEWHLDDHLTTIHEIASKTPLELVYYAAAVLVITALVIYRWKDKPLFLRLALTILPVFVVLYFLWGYPLEIRTLLETYPIVGMLMIPTCFLSLKTEQ